MTIAAQISQIEAGRARFATQWNTKVVPALLAKQTNQVPAQFVMDVGGFVFKNAVTPVLALQQELLRSRTINFANVLGAGTVDRVSKAAQSMQTLNQGIFVDLVNNAIEAKRQHGKTATITIDVTGAQTGVSFGSLVDQILAAAINAFRDLSQVEASIAQTLGIAVAAVVFAVSKLNDAVDELIEVVVTVAKKVYETVDTIARFIDLATKAALIGGAAYLAYILFQPKEQRQNPARRRRPRARQLRA